MKCTRIPRARRAAAVFCLSLFSAGCGVLGLSGERDGAGLFGRVGPDYSGVPPGALPTSGKAVSSWEAALPHGGDTAQLTRWWAQFDDPVLARLIEAAQQESSSVAAAAARIAQAQSVAVAAGANGVPNLDLAATANRGTVVIGTQILLADQIRLGVQSGWEVDLFGRMARERQAATARVQARSAEWHDARVSVAAELAQQYLQLRHCEAQWALARDEAGSLTRSADLTDKAVRAGLQPTTAGAAARAGAAESSQRMIAQRADCDASVKALVALTGIDEPSLRPLLAAGTARLPQPAAFEVRTVPAALLTQRPDLAAAERALAAASADIGVAEGDRYPRLSLSGSIAPLQVRALGEQFLLNTWSIGPSLSLPLFDAGRRRANVEAARQAYGAAEADFRARARQAVREVEEALVRLQSAADRQAQAHVGLKQREAMTQAAQQRWDAGLASLLELEDARRLQLSAQAALLATSRDRVAAWVSLYRALGGGWSQTLEESAR
jgi:outer membrane protein, multidrug efflux system